MERFTSEEQPRCRESCCKAHKS